MNTVNLSARELRSTDIELIADYWSDASADHLIGMGADPNKLPSRQDFIGALSSQINCAPTERQSYCTIWESNNEPVGHCNVNKINFGRDATMHLHLWQPNKRRRGYGAKLVRKSLPFFFDQLQLQQLYCEPNADNLAPNRVLENVGFDFIQRYRTIPGAINFEQDVNRWQMSRGKFIELVSAKT